MEHPDSDGDAQLRTAARASLAHLEAEVDRRAALLELRNRLDEIPSDRTIDGASHRRGRRLVAAAAVLLVAAATALVVIHRGGADTATVAPRPADTIPQVATTNAVPGTETSTTGPTTAGSDASQAPPQLVALLGRTWVITSANGRARAFAASFKMESGKAIGHDGCNFYDSSMLLESTADGAASLRLTFGGSTAAACLPPYTSGWVAPSGRYRVTGDSLTITADDHTTYEAVDLDSLPTITTADEIAGIWTVPDGPSLQFAVDGTIRVPCATIGTWTFSDVLHTTVDQSADASCTDGEVRSLGWTADALLSGTPAIHKLADGSLLFGTTSIGHIVRPTTGSLLRPYVDPALCAPLSANGDGDAAGSSFDLHLFAWPTTATSFPIQVIGNPDGGPTEPFALVQRYPDRNDLRLGQTVAINDWQVALDVRPNNHGVVTGDARWDLPDGGQGYIRSRGIDRDTLVAIISSLTTRDANAAIPGFDFAQVPAVPPTLQLVAEHLNTDVFGRGATLQCVVPATNFNYRISTLDGDAVFQYALVIDRPVPLQVAYKQGTLVVIEGNEDPTAPTVDDVVNADAATWNDLLANPRT